MTIPHSSSVVALTANSPHSRHSLVVTRENKTKLELLRSLIPKEVLLFGLPHSSLEYLIYKAVCS